MDRLTPRQREVAELIALGYTNGEIANQLGCDKRTVGSHRNAILGKLGVRNNVELARLFLDRRVANGAQGDPASRSVRVSRSETKPRADRLEKRAAVADPFNWKVP
jgi:DNA-binding CsgD family transcriptional regulator